MDYILSPFVVATKGLESAIDYIRQGEPSPYLSGNYAPVTEELKEENCHVVEGQIPLEISGVFLRNGKRSVSHSIIIKLCNICWIVAPVQDRIRSLYHPGCIIGLTETAWFIQCTLTVVELTIRTIRFERRR